MHSIGNLTLTGYNSELSNKPFRNKKIFLAESHLESNKYFANITNWNKDSIIERTKILFNICNSIWSYFGTDNILISNDDTNTASPRKLTINDYEYRVESWRDVFEQTCEYLLNFSPEFMDNVDQIYPYYFSQNSDNIKSNRQLSNGIFFNVGLSSKGIISICNRLLDKVGIEKDEWIVDSE